MTLVQLKKKFYSFPQSWNELTGPQLVAVMEVLERPVNALIDAELALFRILAGLSTWQMWRIGGYELEDKLYLVQWVVGANKLTKQLLPQYKGYHGPADDFFNLQVVEFIFADDRYRRYKNPPEGQQPDVSHLNHLCAVLYRPAKKGYDLRRNPEGDPRETFNQNLTSFYAAVIATWPLPVKLAILHWYEGCLAKLVADYPEPFEGESGEAPAFGQWSIMRGVAEKGIHGDINEVEKMFLKTFMMELTEIVRESRKLEKMNKSNTSQHG